MHYFPPRVSQDEERLGELAMKFRGALRDRDGTGLAGSQSGRRRWHPCAKIGCAIAPCGAMGWRNRSPLPAAC